MPGPQVRVFISYGRRDASAFVDKLVADLEREGIDVWRDTEDLKSPQPWEDQLPGEIKRSDLVVAVLTPHAVRAGRGQDPTESVCLDELAYARFSPPPTPIIPIVALPCDPPFVIYRLNYIDFTRAKDEAGYHAALQTLLASIRAVKAGNPVPYRTTKLEPIDFDLYLRTKTKDFVGREWLLNDLLDRLAKSDSHQAVLLLGEPGWGKTAFAGHLFAANPEGQLLAAHFCRADRADTIDARRFVESLIAMVVARIPSVAALVDAAASKNEKLLRTGSVRDALEKCLLEPLASLDPATLGRLPRYILVDGLDEAATATDALTIDALLAGALDLFPSWLRLVATSRPKPGVVDRFGQASILSLDHADERNLSDVRTLIAKSLGENTNFVGLIESKAGGNALCAKQLALAVRNAGMDIRELEKLPRGISALCQSLLQRRFDPSSPAWHMTREIFELILATDGLVPIDLIAQARGDSAQYDTRAAIEYVSDFMVVHNDTVRPFHQTFLEFLQARTSPFFVNAEQGAQKLVELIAEPRRFDRLKPAVKDFCTTSFVRWFAQVPNPAATPGLLVDLCDRFWFAGPAAPVSYCVVGVEIDTVDARLVRHLAERGAAGEVLAVVAKALTRALDRFRQSGVDVWVRDGNAPAPGHQQKMQMAQELEMGLRATALALAWAQTLGESAPAGRPAILKILQADKALPWIIRWLDLGGGVHTLGISGYFEDQAAAILSDWKEIEKSLS